MVSPLRRDPRSRSRSKAEGELTLGLMSGEERGWCSWFALAFAFVGARLARDGDLTVGLIFTNTRNLCGSWLASDGGLTANQSLPVEHGPMVGASLLAKTVSLPKMFIAQSNLQNLPTTLSGCPSEPRSLACVRRCHSATGTASPPIIC